jgi:hypothetical protein
MFEGAAEEARRVVRDERCRETGTKDSVRNQRDDELEMSPL